MAIVIRAKTIILVVLLIIGLAFLFFGFAGESWFKSEPVVNQNDTQDQVVKKQATQPETNTKNKSNAETEDTLLPDSEAKLAEKLNSIQFFEEYRIERDRTRSQQIEILKEITDNNNTKAETREEAQNKLMTITSNLDKEIKLENLIRAKDFKDAVVFIQDASVTVIVLTKDLTETDTETISQLVTRSTGVSIENIIIIPKA